MYSKLYGLETIIFRYFNVYGERQPIRGQYAPVTGIFLRQKAAGQPLTIVGDGEQRRDFVHVQDIVKANLAAASFEPTNDYEWGQIYNIGTETNHSVNQVAELVGGPSVHIPPRNGEARVTLSDTTKARTDLGWKPDIRLEDWISQHR